MSSTFSTEYFIKEFKKSNFVRQNIPIGYVPGLPVLAIQNGYLCMIIPFLKYFVTGEIDNTFVYPIKYLVTVNLPEGNVVRFEDVAYDKAFAHVTFNEPIGKFRHDAVKNLDKEAYLSLKSLLYEEYDKIIAHLIDGKSYSSQDGARFTKLFRQILEPSLQPFYFAIDNNFANKYLK